MQLKNSQKQKKSGTRNPFEERLNIFPHQRVKRFRSVHSRQNQSILAPKHSKTEMAHQKNTQQDVRSQEAVVFQPDASPKITPKKSTLVHKPRGAENFIDKRGRLLLRPSLSSKTAIASGQT
ncbi:hypothetical protein G8770_05385 [Aestuariicella hydrocarbonica]|uniref:Uncharacterized protein n=1 Tax=Pseudomaricurvus hydrocarbonicus TaxID=1470433 RepID=A0A9E5MLM8_9GAMM|nr:hypothetical protein [Aestuariicella hydrocarbonica]NHO64973.1 hypothetical protein [Aestuariicella hydrocarbonica]